MFTSVISADKDVDGFIGSKNPDAFDKFFGWRMWLECCRAGICGPNGVFNLWSKWRVLLMWRRWKCRVRINLLCLLIFGTSNTLLTFKFSIWGHIRLLGWQRLRQITKCWRTRNCCWHDKRWCFGHDFLGESSDLSCTGTEDFSPSVFSWGGRRVDLEATFWISWC